MKLGINIDHIATLREQRKENDPNLCDAAKIVLRAGADSITVHLREDRRHIQDQDVHDLKQFVPFLNLELSTAPDIVELALEIKPNAFCLVPEKREELTTEGGLNVIQQEKVLRPIISKFKETGGIVSLFVDPEETQINAVKDVGATHIEIHTGTYAIATGLNKESELSKIKDMAEYAKSIGLTVHAGHGLNYSNVGPIATIPEIEELNIGHSIVCKSLFIGLENAVKEMKHLVSAQVN